MHPIVNALPIIIFISVIELRERFKEKFYLVLNSKMFKRSFLVYITINFIILLGRATYPAEDNLTIAQYIQKEIHKNKLKELYLISYDSHTVFQFGSLSGNFYKPKEAKEEIIGKDAPPQKRNEKILSFVKKLQEQNIDQFFIYHEHKKFYLGDPPFPEDFLFIRSQCSFEYNMLEEIEIKYNLYRLIRGKSTIKTIFRCSI